MAAPSKKRAVDNEMSTDDVTDDDDAEDDTDGDEEDGQQYINQEIKVEFEARSMEDSDFHGIRKLLGQLFLKANVDLSELTNALISQNYIGSVIKQVELDDDDDGDEQMDIDDNDDSQVFGVISVINITEKKDLKCIGEIKSMLLERCSKCANRDKLSATLDDSQNSVGLIINERFINIPGQISLPSYQSLWKEVERANNKKMNYKFTHYVVLSKACCLRLKGPHQKDFNKTFLNEEDEYFNEAADFTCEYSVKGERDSMVTGGWDEDDDEMEPIRVVMVITANKIAGIMEKLKEVYG